MQPLEDVFIELEFTLQVQILHLFAKFEADLTEPNTNNQSGNKQPIWTCTQEIEPVYKAQIMLSF